MDVDRQRAVFTHFIQPFLSRKDLPDPGCVSSANRSQLWLQANIGNFSQFASIEDLKALYPNFSSVEVLSKLSPSQVAELLLSTDISNDTQFVDEVFARLEVGNAVENVDAFFTKLTENGKVPEFQVAVRDRIMNKTYIIIGPVFPEFSEKVLFDWFHVKLVPVLPSFTPLMLHDVITNINCTKYQVIVSGMGKVVSAIAQDRQEEIAAVLLQYLKNSADVINQPACRVNIQTDSQWVETNLGPFSQYATYSELKFFNLSQGALVSVLSPEQKAELLTDPGSNALEDATLVKEVLTNLTEPGNVEQLGQFFLVFTQSLQQTNTTYIQNVAVRETILNLTLSSLALEFDVFEVQDYQLWFQVYLIPVIASIQPDSLRVIPRNISCESYRAIVTGLLESLNILPLDISMDVRSSLQSLQEAFPDCASLDSFTCKDTHVDEKLICSGVDSSRLHALENDNSLEAVCNFTVTEHACAPTRTLSAENLAKLLKCSLESNQIYVVEVWQLLFQKASPVLSQALTSFSQMAPTAIGSAAYSNPLDALREVLAKNLTQDQLKSEGFVGSWFQGGLVPFLASPSTNFLSCLGTYNFSCQTYQIVIGAFSNQSPLMDVDRQRAVFTHFIQPFLFRKDLPDPGCVSSANSSQLWLQANIGNFSQFASIEDLQALYPNFSSSTIAEFLLQPDILANVSLFITVFDHFTASASLKNLESFFKTFVDGLAKQHLTAFNTNIRENILNLTITALAPKFYLLNSEGFRLWFQIYLPLFLPSLKSTTFEIIPRNISCSSYQQVIKGLDNIFSQLSEAQKQEVLKFGLDYLKAQSMSGLSCVDAGTETNDTLWLEDNFGQFRIEASFKDFLSLKKDFKGAEVAALLTFSQLKELAATPSQLKGTQDVTKVMTVIVPADFAAFFDSLSQAVAAQSMNYTQEVKSAFLQEVFNRGGLPAVSDKDFLQWLRRLQPLLTDLSPNLVPRLFSLAANRSCATSQDMINMLDTIQTTLSNNTKTEVYRNILIFLQDSTPLKCYSGGSFYLFLQNSFLSFGFPDVATFISLLPPKHESELLNTISTSELSQFLNQPDIVNNSTDICVIFSNYNNTPSFLENEDVPDYVRRIILPCVWPLALSSNRRSEVDLWFNIRLRNYLRFLTKDLISFNKVQNSSCLSFQKLVSFMGKNFTYTGSDFGRPDVYAIIRSYLGAESVTRCYNPTDPDLNSTSWFVNYIGTFVIFITLDDFKGFVNTSQLKVFLEDKANLELFNNAAISQDVTNYYIMQLYEFYPSFGVIMLPGFLLCSPDIPSSSFASLSETDTMAILDKLKTFCNSTENPERSAALASNIKVITAQTFAELGSASSGLTNSQILSVPPAVLVSSLSTLGSVNTWGQDQASNIIHSIISSGFQINSTASLASLGTLIIGVPSKLINSISASEALSASKNPTFVSNMLQAPEVVQEIFVKKIISVDSSPAKVVENVPDALATEIPLSLLVFSEGTANITVINQKTWTADQATMFFATLAQGTFDIEQLSPFVLQGFTCGTVKKMTKARISQLIHACRPRNGRAKVELKEPQLTCMYNLMRGDLSQNFTDYPSDMLLYLDSKNVQKANCRSYFSALGATDFSVASSILNKGPQKFREARDCLGISGVSLSKDNVEVLGNMVCTLNRADIENSDPLILEKLKACKDLSASQVAAVETLLLSGKTQYGAVNSWNQQTLEGLGTLPLYLTRNIWTYFTATIKKRFLKGFMPDLRKQKTQKKKLKTLFSELTPIVAKRGAGCSEGNITQVTISDPSFPFGYNELQFELCLDVPILRDNLYSICQKVDDDGYQTIILKKLNQAFPSGVPDQEVQMLASVSRSATLDDISKWNITELDTLAALMNPEDGTWEMAQSKAIITKYLNASGNSLDSNELNIIGSNLCSLDTSTLQTITADSLRNTKYLDVASCSTEQKRVLYEISNSSFSTNRDNPINFFNLIKGYLGGAPQADIVALSRQNISMDIGTFRSLDINAITNLTVADVQGLMGENIRDLKLFENDTVVQRWVNLQPQSALDTLGLGLITTRADPAVPAASTVPTPTNGTQPQGNTNSSSTTLASTVTPSQSTTTSGVLEFTKSPASVFLTALLTAALQIILQPA